MILVGFRILLGMHTLSDYGVAFAPTTVVARPRAVKSEFSFPTGHNTSSCLAGKSPFTSHTLRPLHLALP